MGELSEKERSWARRKLSHGGLVWFGLRERKRACFGSGFKGATAVASGVKQRWAPMTIGLEHPTSASFLSLYSQLEKIHLVRVWIVKGGFGDSGFSNLGGLNWSLGLEIGLVWGLDWLGLEIWLILLAVVVWSILFWLNLRSWIYSCCDLFF